MNDTDTTHLVDTLDATDEPWQLYRAASNKWIVQRGKGRTDPAFRTLEADTIPEVLQLAIDSKRLPVIPRKPLLHHYACTRQGTGSRPWKLTRDGAAIINLKLKREAEMEVERYHEAQLLARDAWVNEHFHFTSTHTAGVDFYWVDR